MPHVFALRDISASRALGEAPDSFNVVDALGDADNAARVKHIESMRAFEHVIDARQYEAALKASARLLLTRIKLLEQHLGVGAFKGVTGVLHFALVVYISVLKLIVPADVEETIDVLQVERDAFEPVGELGTDRIELYASHLLKVGELRDFGAVPPDLPAQARSPKRRRFPIILNETQIVLARIDAQMTQTLKIQRQHIRRRRLQDDLILIVRAKPKRIFAIASVGWPPHRLDIGNLPRFGPQTAQKGCRVKCPGADFNVARLLDGATVVRPKFLQGEDDFLKSHGFKNGIRKS